MGERFYIVQALNTWPPDDFADFWESSADASNYEYPSRPLAEHERDVMIVEDYRWARNAVILSTEELNMAILSAHAAHALGLKQGEWGA